MHERVGRAGDVRYGHEGLPIGSILGLHPASVFVEKPLDAQHLVPVETSLLRPARRCECLARLVPYSGDGQPLLGAQMALGTDGHADFRQRNRLDGRGHLHRQGVAGGDPEECRVRGSIPDPLGSQPVFAGGRDPQLEHACTAPREHPLDAAAVPVHQGDHRPRNGRVVPLVDEPATHHLAVNDRRKRALEHDQRDRRDRQADPATVGASLASRPVPPTPCSPGRRKRAACDLGQPLERFSIEAVPIAARGSTARTFDSVRSQPSSLGSLPVERTTNEDRALRRTRGIVTGTTPSSQLPEAWLRPIRSSHLHRLRLPV